MTDTSVSVAPWSKAMDAYTCRRCAQQRDLNYGGLCEACHGEMFGSEPARPADPRKVGGVYWSGYWAEQYTVLAIQPSHCYDGTTCFTVKWAERGGTNTGTSHHSTAWNFGRDRIISEPVQP